MQQIMPIPNVVALVARAWAEAEEATLRLLAQKHWDQDEEFVTELFRGEFRQSVQGLAETDAIGTAFLQDLHSQFPALMFRTELSWLATGVSATTTFHPREVERRTGGDLGIVLLRPSVESGLYADTLEIHQDYARGILCQAKVNQRPRKSGKAYWGGLTSRQKEVLPSRTRYLALLLYKYAEENRRSLLPFLWQVCEGVTVAEIEGWLKNDTFPDLWRSANILEGLGDCTIGSDDPTVIEELIAPRVRDALVIRIGWPSEDPPPDTLTIAESHRVRQRQVQAL